MKIKKEFKPELVASSDAYRTGLNRPELVGDEVRVTDGRMLAVFPIERERGDVDGPIPKEAIRRAHAATARRRKVGDFQNVIMKLPKNHAIVADEMAGETAVIRRLRDGQFPDNTKTDGVFPGEGKRYRVAINAQMLLTLVEALGSRGACELSLRAFPDTGEIDSSAPIEVINGDDRTKDLVAYGVMMPMRISAKDKPPRLFKDRKLAAPGVK